MFFLPSELILSYLQPWLLHFVRSFDRQYYTRVCCRHHVNSARAVTPVAVLHAPSPVYVHLTGATRKYDWMFTDECVGASMSQSLNGDM